MKRVSKNFLQSRARCLSMMRQRSKSRWKKWATTQGALVTTSRKAPSSTSSYSPARVGGIRGRGGGGEVVGWGHGRESRCAAGQRQQHPAGGSGSAAAPQRPSTHRAPSAASSPAFPPRAAAAPGARRAAFPGLGRPAGRPHPPGRTRAPPTPPFAPPASPAAGGQAGGGSGHELGRRLLAGRPLGARLGAGRSCRGAQAAALSPACSPRPQRPSPGQRPGFSSGPRPWPRPSCLPPALLFPRGTDQTEIGRAPGTLGRAVQLKLSTRKSYRACN